VRREKVKRENGEGRRGFEEDEEERV